MKLSLCFAAFAALMIAQDAKVAQAPHVGAPAMTVKADLPTERPLTADEVTKLSLAMAQMQVLRDKYKVDDLEKQYREFQQEAARISAPQEMVAKVACESVGVAEDKIKTGGCGLSLSQDATGKPVMGPDGKPVPSRVWRVPPPVSQTTLLPADKK